MLNEGAGMAESV